MKVIMIFNDADKECTKLEGNLVCKQKDGD